MAGAPLKAFKAARALTRNVPYLMQQNTNVKPMASVSTYPILSPQLTPSSSSGSERSTISAFQKPLPRPITNTICRKPIPNSYWATPMLVACEYPWAPSTTRPKLDALLAAGVRTFIDLTENGELLQYQSLLPARATACGLTDADAHTIEYFRFPIPDRKLPESMDFIGRIMAVLRDCERRGRKAAVHCRGGIGRTGTVIGCWLVESGVAKDGEEALKIIATEWKTVDKCRRFPCTVDEQPATY